MKSKKASLVASSVLVAVGIVGFASAEPSRTKGNIPEHAFVNGAVREDLVPDYVVAYDRQGEVAGYVSKADLFEGGGRHRDTSIIVLDETLKRPVGRMVPGEGFVPFGRTKQVETNAPIDSDDGAETAPPPD
jgi:hypothetical protein